MNHTTTAPPPALAATTAPKGTATVLWVLWATYGSFYFCRTNLSAALPGIQQEFGYTKAEMGGVLAALKIAYGVGQLVNGHVAEWISPKRLLALGLLLSAGLNVLFGFGEAIGFFAIVWALNGYSQALGWTPTMRVAANWLPPLVRGRSIGLIGTGYMVGASLTFVVAGKAAGAFGWRGVLWVPSAILVLSCVHMLLLLREAPEGHARAESTPAAARPPGLRFETVLRLTLGNVDLWLLALGLGLVNAVRYGYVDWGVTLIKEVQGSTVEKAAIDFAILPAGGIVGSLGAGWVSDRVFGGRRAPVLVILLLALAGLTLVFEKAVHMGTFATIATLFCVGIAVYGPQVLLVGTMPTDLARGGTVAASVGFVNFMGYMGAAAGDKITGNVATHGWKDVFGLWAGWAALAAVLAAILWKRVPADRVAP